MLDETLHAGRQLLQVGAKQQMHEFRNTAFIAFPQRRRARGEELARRRCPERIGRVLEGRDQGGGDHVQILLMAHLAEEVPVMRPGIQRVQDDVALRPVIMRDEASHLVIDDGLAAPLADLVQQCAHRHRLAAAGGADHHRMAGLGALRPGDAGKREAWAATV